jgi:hypothetical protein
LIAAYAWPVISQIRMITGTGTPINHNKHDLMNDPRPALHNR